MFRVTIEKGSTKNPVNFPPLEPDVFVRVDIYRFARSLFRSGILTPVAGGSTVMPEDC